MLATQMPDAPPEAKDVKQVKQAETFPAYRCCLGASSPLKWTERDSQPALSGLGMVVVSLSDVQSVFSPSDCLSFLP